GVKQPCDATAEAALGGRLVARERGGERADDPGRPIGQIDLACYVLVSEPQRRPASVWPLIVREVQRATLCSVRNPALQIGSDRGIPDTPGLERVRRQIRRAPIERQRAPSSTERWDAAVAVLQVEQPPD